MRSRRVSRRYCSNQSKSFQINSYWKATSDISLPPSLPPPFDWKRGRRVNSKAKAKNSDCKYCHESLLAFVFG